MTKPIKLTIDNFTVVKKIFRKRYKVVLQEIWFDTIEEAKAFKQQFLSNQENTKNCDECFYGDRIDKIEQQNKQLKALRDSLFGEKPTHAYMSNAEFEKLKVAAEKWKSFALSGHILIPKKEFANLKRIKKIGIELLDACKKTKETNNTYNVIQKFHDFKFAIFPKGMNS